MTDADALLLPQATPPLAKSLRRAYHKQLAPGASVPACPDWRRYRTLKGKSLRRRVGRRRLGEDCPSASSKETVMSWEDREDTTIYKVVVNHEEQYSIWPADRENPLGWNDVGKSGNKEECLAYIKEVWTDMRPLSLRKKMEEMERERQASQGTN